MKFRKNKGGGFNPINDSEFLSELYKNDYPDSYNDFITNSTTSTDISTIESDNSNDDLAFDDFKKEFNDIRNKYQKERIEKERIYKTKKNREDFEKHVSPIKSLSQPKRFLKMIKDIPTNSKDIIKNEAKDFVSDVSDKAFLKVYNQDLKLKSMVEQDAIKETYQQKINDLNEKMKKEMEDEKILEDEKTKIENQKNEEEESLNNFSSYSKDISQDTIDIEEITEKIKKIKFTSDSSTDSSTESDFAFGPQFKKEIKSPYDNKYSYLIKETEFYKGSEELRLIAYNWIFYNNYINFENYNELFGDINKNKLNNAIDIIIERTYDKMNNIPYRSNYKKYDLCVFILVLLKIKYFKVIDMSDQLKKRGYGGKKIINCCNHTKKHKKCIRKNDKKIFKLPRKFTKKQCKNPRGFTMKASCSPYKNCGNKKKKSKKN